MLQQEDKYYTYKGDHLLRQIKYILSAKQVKTYWILVDAIGARS